MKKLRIVLLKVILAIFILIFINSCTQKPIEPILCDSSVPVEESDFELKLSNHIGEVKSLEELEMWLNSQECVKSARLLGRIIETLPAQREISIKLKMVDGSISDEIIDVYLLEDNKFKFSRIHGRR